LSKIDSQKPHHQAEACSIQWRTSLAVIRFIFWLIFSYFAKQCTEYKCLTSLVKFYRVFVFQANIWRKRSSKYM
jgi:hypothetical protein